MDTEGNIRELLGDETPKMNEIGIDKKPDPNCKDCYGKGFQRWVIKNIAETKPCHCTRKATEKI